MVGEIMSKTTKEFLRVKSKKKGGLFRIVRVRKTKREKQEHKFDVLGYCKVCGEHALENLMNKTCKGRRNNG